MTDQIPEEFAEQLADVTSHRIEGIARMGNVPFSCPLVTRVEGNLWQGGSPEGSQMPGYFKYVLNLYPWGIYRPASGTTIRFEWLVDAGDIPDPELLAELADWVNEKRAIAPTLVHCQAGLNRSALVTAYALIRSGAKPAKAIQQLRERRSPAVLCNEYFESWLLEQEVLSK